MDVTISPILGCIKQCCTYRYQEFIAKGPKLKLSEISGKISEIIGNYRETLKKYKNNHFFNFLNF
jgi:hypothetical protein